LWLNLDQSIKKESKTIIRRRRKRSTKEINYSLAGSTLRGQKQNKENK